VVSLPCFNSLAWLGEGPHALRCTLGRSATGLCTGSVVTAQRVHGTGAARLRRT
jgi:hypothetical protein